MKPQSMFDLLIFSPHQLPTFGESDGGVVGVDRVEDALVTDVELGDEADLGTDVGSLA